MSAFRCKYTSNNLYFHEAPWDSMDQRCTGKVSLFINSKDPEGMKKVCWFIDIMVCFGSTMYRICLFLKHHRSPETDDVQGTKF